MTTDLSNKTVKQLRRMAPGHDDLLRDCITGEAADELARRIDESQKQIEAMRPLVGCVMRHALAVSIYKQLADAGKPIEEQIEAAKKIEEAEQAMFSALGEYQLMKQP